MRTDGKCVMHDGNVHAATHCITATEAVAALHGHMCSCSPNSATAHALLAPAVEAVQLWLSATTSKRPTETLTIEPAAKRTKVGKRESPIHRLSTELQVAVMQWLNATSLGRVEVCCRLFQQPRRARSVVQEAVAKAMHRRYPGVELGLLSWPQLLHLHDGVSEAVSRDMTKGVLDQKLHAITVGSQSEEVESDPYRLSEGHQVATLEYVVHALKETQPKGVSTCIHRQMGATILLNYLEKRGAPMVIASGGLSQVLQLLCDSDKTCKILAVQALDLICDKLLSSAQLCSVVDQLFASGGFQSLLQLLCEGDKEAQGCAANAFTSICSSDRHRDSIVEQLKASGGLQHLLQLLCKGDTTRRSVTSGTLTTLCHSDQHRDAAMSAIHYWSAAI